MSKVIGIDLGTTYSVMAYINNGHPVLIPNAEGSPLTPSVVSWDKDGIVYVGELARDRAIFDPSRTIFSIKRQMGKQLRISIDNTIYTPQTVSARILRKMKNDAEKYLNERIDKAVITVPAYFNEAARQATKEAGQIAGFDVVRILNEPTAACLAYGLGKKEGELVVVIDLGGGTFDVSILDFANGVYEVRATCGDTWLGGDDWTEKIAVCIMEKCKKDWGRPVSTRPEIRQRIEVAAEAAKIELTVRSEAKVRLPCLEDGEGFLRSFHTVIKRDEFEAVTKDVLERLISPMQDALRDSKLSFEDVDKVILVGGATRMPSVRNLIREMSGREPFTDIDPDLVVGLGAAVQAGILAGEIADTVLVDVIPLSLGVETRGGIFARIIPRNSAIPTSRSQIFTTAKDGQTEVDIHVLQGERELALHNVSLGSFQLTGIPPLPKGVAKIEVIFSMDANGILNVAAADVYTGNEQALTIKLSRMDADEIAKLAEDAVKCKEYDGKARDRIMARLKADDIINAAVETLPRLSGKGVSLERINDAIAHSRRLLENGDVEELKVSISRLQMLMDKVHSKREGHAEKISS